MAQPNLAVRPSDPHALDALVSRYGVVSGTWTRPDLTEDPLPFAFCGAAIGSGRPGVGRTSPDDRVNGGGAAFDNLPKARFVAIAEAAERYAGMDVTDREVRVATARQLAGECLEPERYPRCSAHEHAHPQCPVIPFDPDRPMRWLRGVDLATGEATWVPAIMACSGLRGQNPDEQVTVPISTGNCVHSDPIEAVVGGLCEVIERDAVAVTWLQQLPLPRLAAADRSARLAELVEWHRRRFVTVHVFDATLDLGVPTALCVLAADHDLRAARLVGAGTGRTLALAAEKALVEATGLRTGLQAAVGPVPAGPESFRQLADGARYMGLPTRAHAFDFLLDDSTPRTPRQPGDALPANPAAALAAIANRLEEAGMRAVAVDRTTEELAGVGLTAVCVVVPDLQPFSPHPLAQFTAHPRLYEVPRRLGWRVRTEKELNQWPNPLA
jgi:ribosomal protein S12 methylthiotransferase accessory factor